MSFFAKPYPFYPFSSKEVLKQFLIACFIAFFLIVFQPFDINIWKTSHKTLKLLSFGLLSFLIPFFIKLAFFFVKIDEDKWTIGREMLMVVFSIMCVAGGNLLLACFYSIVTISWGAFMAAFLVTVLIAIFPLTFSIIYKHNHFLKLNSREAELMETRVHDFQKKNEEVTITESSSKPSDAKQVSGKIVLLAENEKEKFEFMPEQLLFIESLDNYSNIVYLESEKIKKLLLRGSLKRLEQQIKHPYILRCHRRYIISLLHINQVKGNAQGYRIQFKFPTENTIPVSRNHSKSVFERLDTLN